MIQKLRDCQGDYSPKEQSIVVTSKVAFSENRLRGNRILYQAMAWYYTDLALDWPSAGIQSVIEAEPSIATAESSQEFANNATWERPTVNLGYKEHSQ